MEQLNSTIRETIREVFEQNESLSDIDLAYTFLLGNARRPANNLLKDFNYTAKAGLEFYTSRYKPKEPKYINRKFSQKLVEELTERTLELLEHMIGRAGDNLDDIDVDFLDQQQFFEAGQYDFSEVIKKANEGKQRIVTGRILKVSHRSSGKKKFAYLTVEDYKGQKLIVLVSSYFYSSYESDMKNCKGKYLGLSGIITYDNFRKSLIIKAYELDIVKGYHIPRVPITTF